ncbi:hypothetical protein L228DRAFT_268191 [Xylona heveae TC161]|uniref:Uncharacterized protein n=1 Tax=Xylona heveae (strain CBS 132557 / TC161) TaxID=1328760 RepID=A0A165GZW0_XYLHT|nr:hypothetical protein L228DRAFT_268191 [Xylona heveae TC161]KZF22810.1 hypothetical protein L228DRAFT_268191 [Xylona heveae TC161]
MGTPPLDQPACTVEQRGNGDDDVIFVSCRPCAHRAVPQASADKSVPIEPAATPQTSIAESLAERDLLSGEPAVSKVEKSDGEASQVIPKLEPPVETPSELKSRHQSALRACSEPNISLDSSKVVRPQPPLSFGGPVVENGEANSKQAKLDLATNGTGRQHIPGKPDKSIAGPKESLGTARRRASFDAPPIKTHDWVRPEWCHDSHSEKKQENPIPLQPPVSAVNLLPNLEHASVELARPKEIVPAKRNQESIGNTGLKENRHSEEQQQQQPKRARVSLGMNQDPKENLSPVVSDQPPLADPKKRYATLELFGPASRPYYVPGKGLIRTNPPCTLTHRRIAGELVASFPLRDPEAEEGNPSVPGNGTVDSPPRNQTLWSVPAFDASVDPRLNPGITTTRTPRGFGYEPANKDCGTAQATATQYQRPQTAMIPPVAASLPSNAGPVNRGIKEKKYTWTPKMYLDFSLSLYQNYGFQEFAHRHGLPLTEVIDKFSAIVQLPFLDEAENAGTETVSICRKRVASFKQREKEVLEIHKAEERAARTAEKERAKAATRGVEQRVAHDGFNSSSMRVGGEVPPHGTNPRALHAGNISTRVVANSHAVSDPEATGRDVATTQTSMAKLRETLNGSSNVAHRA